MINKTDELAPHDRNEHLTIVERRTEWPPARVTCTCGFDRGWQATLVAEQDAEDHRDQIARVQVPSAIRIERKHVPGRAVFRWRCTCGRTGVWLENEEVARRNSALHVHRDEEIIANASAIDS